MDLNKIFSFEFWTIVRPDELTQKTLIILLVVFGLFGVASIIFSLIKKKENKGPYVKLWQKLASLSLTCALVGFALTFLRYERIPYLGAHFWFLLLALGLLVWGIFILKYLLKDVPKIKKEHSNKKEFNKYLP